jgi:hypothetical protein
MKTALNIAWLSSVAVAFLPTLLLHVILIFGYGPARDQAFQMIVLVPLFSICLALLIGCVMMPKSHSRTAKIAAAWIPYALLGWLYYDKFLSDMGYGFSYGGAL